VNIGYARVSTQDQNLGLQRDSLDRVPCDKIFEDQGVSGSTMERPGLEAALSHLREGDVLVIWKLDRLGRTIRGLIDLVGQLRERGVGFRSLTEGFDTSTPGGRLVFHIFAALAEMERDLIRERTRAGLTAARARGRTGGRRPKITPQRLKHARALLNDPDASVDEVAGTLGVHRATLYRALSHEAEINRSALAQDPR
jgi:DNA invertase Pin-like site-specific DNA recombinase